MARYVELYEMYRTRIMWRMLWSPLQVLRASRLMVRKTFGGPVFGPQSVVIRALLFNLAKSAEKEHEYFTIIMANHPLHDLSELLLRHRETHGVTPLADRARRFSR